MTIVQVDINTIKPYPKNSKKHPVKQVESIASSIREFGWGQPIVVDREDTIVIGHGRYEAALLMGLDEVPVLKLEHLTPTQAKAYRLADNRLNESEWDLHIVIEELKDLDASNYNVDLTGFDKELILDQSRDTDVDISDDELKTFLTNSIQKIVLYFEEEQFDDIVKRLKRIADANSLASNTDVFVKLLEHYERTNS